MQLGNRKGRKKRDGGGGNGGLKEGGEDEKGKKKTKHFISTKSDVTILLKKEKFPVV